MDNGNTLTIDAFWTSNTPFPGEEPINSKIGKVFHDGYTGTAKHLGWMNLIELKYIIQRRDISHLILKNLALLGQAAEAEGVVKVCTSYIYKHKIITHPLPASKELKDYNPSFHVVEFGGWTFSDDDDDIPYRAKYYMRYLLIHTKVRSVSYSSNKIKVVAYFDENDTPDFCVEHIL